MEEDSLWTLLELQKASGTQNRTVHRILRNELHLRKIAARWVPHALTEVQRWLRYAICSDHFARWQQDGDEFLSRIISHRQILGQGIRTRTETSVHGVATCWISKEAEVLQNPSPVKLIVIVAYDVRGVIVFHFVPHGRTVDRTVLQGRSGTTWRSR
ncbi:histone-lysine N-methyltransferase SETMAR [Trichonephila inaurata madagascariensis]|uniref:Histone-lysine N-methyltransferase SETMAR n=1 Tax=Trichonephila inaurata madagascariensis TaxID=2747483 RepID=A0A8X6XQ00_9ARAC|nr:histone-lysine N-methyltransferase SETMAR [Trichonephila inaurata madagascariensis]